MKRSKKSRRVKSTRTTLKFANTGKLAALQAFIDEYRLVVERAVNALWDLSKVPALPSSPITDVIGVDTWLSARAVQAAIKQASAIVRGTRKKQSDRAWRIKKLRAEGHLRAARKLQAIYDAVKMSRPNINNINPELDSRFVDLDFHDRTSFDGWLTLSSLGERGAGVAPIVLPVRKSRHFNALVAQSGTMTAGVRISPTEISFTFDMPPVLLRVAGRTTGVDIGMTTTLTTSDGQSVAADPHGHTYQSICATLSRRTKDSKGFDRAVAHRTNYLGWSVNQLNFNNVKQVNIEDIKGLRRGHATSRLMSHWNYAELFGKLTNHCADLGVLVNRVNPAYTSQRCSACGWTRRTNRKGKSFRCTSCGYAADADVNAALNLALPLLVLPPAIRLQRRNLAGFWWGAARPSPVVSEEPVVSRVLEAMSII